MKSLIVSALLILTSHLFAQNCDCSTQFSTVVTYFENNNPAFQKIKTDRKEYRIYLAGVKKLQKEVKQEKDIDRCIVYLDRYVSLLKDHHSGIGFNLERKDLGSAELIDQFRRSADYQKFKKLAIDSSKIVSHLMTKQAEDIEGIYSDGRNTVFGIIKKENAPGKYIGVVLKQNKLLDVGHVLLELTQKQNNFYDIVYNIGLLGFNFQKIFKRLEIKNGQISSFGFSKTMNATPGEKPYEFKPLDASANYLRLSSFDGRLVEELDVFYDSLSKEIKSKPYLIIDLRNNGGGSERSYLKLLQYAYTKPLQIDPAEVWVSGENIRRYEEAEHGDNKELIERMKKARLFTFIPQSTDTNLTWALDSVTVFPKKIALLFNRGTASAAEGMIVYFMQSEKVITFGENSGGYIGYGNVMTSQTPCRKFTIQSTTTKYSEKSKYEFVGIPPNYTVPEKHDWIEYAKQLLHRTN
jgi:hypothetical protein